MASMILSSPSVELPIQIWDQIISILNHDRHLEPLSLVSKTFLSITNHHKQTLKIFNSTTQFPPRLLHRFPNIKHISFSEFPNDPLPILLQIASDFDIRLETLDLSNHQDFSLHGFEKLPALMLNGLKSLKMRSRTYLKPHVLESIAYFFPNLEELDLSYPSNRNQDYKSFSYRGCSNQYSNSTSHRKSVSEIKSLRKINFKGNRGLSDDVLSLLSKNCPNLEEIVVEGCCNVTRNGAVFALQACKNLELIELDLRFDHDTLQSLCWPKTLSKIRVSGDDDLLCRIIEAGLPLKSFAFSCCWGTSVSGILSFVQYYNSLEYLSIKCTENGLLIDASIAKYLTSLRSLKLNKCGRMSYSELFDLIRHCPLLESVKLKNTYMCNDIWFKAENVVNPAIRSLNLSNSGNLSLSDESLKEIALACPNLEMLRLSSCGEISSEGVGEIMRNCGGLKQLRIDGCRRVTSLDFDSKSRRIHKLESLVACETSLNDKALIDIAEKCPDLVVLNVSRCKRLTSSGVLKVVDKCTKLKKLNVSGCKNMSGYMVSWIVVNRPILRLS